MDRQKDLTKFRSFLVDKNYILSLPVQIHDLTLTSNRNQVYILKCRDVRAAGFTLPSTPHLDLIENQLLAARARQYHQQSGPRHQRSGPRVTIARSSGRSLRVEQPQSPPPKYDTIDFTTHRTSQQSFRASAPIHSFTLRHAHTNHPRASSTRWYNLLYPSDTPGDSHHQRENTNESNVTQRE